MGMNGWVGRHLEGCVGGMDGVETPTEVSYDWVFDSGRRLGLRRVCSGKGLVLEMAFLLARGSGSRCHCNCVECWQG